MILLDTCTIIYASDDKPISNQADAAIQNAHDAGGLFVSLISAWEIGQLASRGRLAIATDPLRYFRVFLEKSQCRLCEISYELLIASSFLPGNIHRDPMDRIIIETARRNDLTVVTRDRAILAYGKEGHVRTLAC